MKRNTISLIAALALTTSVAYAGYGAAAGYSQTKYVSVSDNEWVLVGMSGLSKFTNVAGGLNAVAFDMPGGIATAAYGHTATNLTNFSTIIDSNSLNPTILSQGEDGNASVTLQVEADYETKLKSYYGSDFALDINDSATVLFSAKQSLNLPDENVLEIYLNHDGTNYTDKLAELKYDEEYDGETIYLSLEGRDLTSQYNFVLDPLRGQASVFNDPNKDQYIKVWENVDMNESNQSGFAVLGDGAFTTPQLAETNLTVYTFDSVHGNSWKKFDANGSEINGTNGTEPYSFITDVDTGLEKSVLEKGKAYWYRVNTSDAIDTNASIAVRNDGITATEIQKFSTADGWSLIALPEGHIRFPQTAVYVDTQAGQIDLEGMHGAKASANLAAGSKGNDELINKAVKDLNGSGILNIRAYSANNGNGVLIFGDHTFKVSGGAVNGITSVGGEDLTDKLLVEENRSILGEQSLAITLDSEFLAKNLASSFTIEIPNLPATVEVDVSDADDLDGVVAEINATLQDTVANGGAGLDVADFGLNIFDANMDDTDDSILISFKASKYRTTSASYKDTYLRFGIRDNTIVKPFVAPMEINASGDLNYVAASNTIAVKDLTTEKGSGVVEINSTGSVTAIGVGLNVDDITTENSDFNLTSDATDYAYFVTTDRQYDIYEVNQTDTLIDVRFVSSADRISQYGMDLNTSIMSGAISHVFTMDNLAQAKLTTDGNLTSPDTTIPNTPAAYSIVDDLTMNSVWSADLPDAGPMYELVTAGRKPQRIYTYAHRGDIPWHDIDLGTNFDPAKWLDIDNLLYLAPENGYWLNASSSATDYSSIGLADVTPASSFVVTHFDNTNNKSYNYVHGLAEVNLTSANVGDTNLLYNFKVNGGFSGQSISVSGGNDRYSVYIDPFNTSDMSETASVAKSITAANGYKVTTATMNALSVTKPAQVNPIITNNVIGYTGTDTLYVHNTYIDENNSANTVVTLNGTAILPKSLEMNTTDYMSGDMNLTTLKIFVKNSDGLASDLNETIYIPFNALILNDGITTYTQESDLDSDFYTKLDTTGNGTLDTIIAYEILEDKADSTAANTSQDALQNPSNTPYKYDVDGNLITAGTMANNNDGVQIQSMIKDKKVVLTYRSSHNTATGSSNTTPTGDTMLLRDGAVKIANLEFNPDYSASGSTFYMYSEETNSIYAAQFQDGPAGSDWEIDCSATTPSLANPCYTVVDSDWAGTIGDTTTYGADKVMMFSAPTTTTTAR